MQIVHCENIGLGTICVFNPIGHASFNVILGMDHATVDCYGKTVTFQIPNWHIFKLEGIRDTFNPYFDFLYMSTLLLVGSTHLLSKQRCPSVQVAPQRTSHCFFCTRSG